MFSFMGTEIVTIAAAESPDPEQGIRKAVNSVIWRISLFYLGSIFVVVALVPWNYRAWSSDGSYQPSLRPDRPRQPRTVLDLVILTAVASCLNSALYTASRMAFSLVQPRRRPAGLVARSPATACRPARSSRARCVGFLGVIGNYAAARRRSSATCWPARVPSRCSSTSSSRCPS